jgi:GT2 family glycosyltransferase
MNSFLEELCVVLVIYKIKINESPAYRSLTGALETCSKSVSLFIYDNSPTQQEIPIDPHWQIHYQSDASNPGVSKAYNMGFKYAKAANKRWLLLSDQDTDFPNNAFNEYFRGTEKFRSPVTVPVLVDRSGIVSPFKFYFGGGQRQKKIVMGSALLVREFFFTNSGMLISTECFENVNGYDEQFRLDYSDIDFVLRLRNKTEYFVLADFECRHDLTTTNSTFSEVLIGRFRNYIRASREFRKKYPQFFWIPFRVFLQAAKYSWRHKNFAFIIVYLK